MWTFYTASRMENPSSELAFYGEQAIPLDLVSPKTGKVPPVIDKIWGNSALLQKIAAALPKDEINYIYAKNEAGKIHPYIRSPVIE